jgi:hypothetical protein
VHALQFATTLVSFLLALLLDSVESLYLLFALQIENFLHVSWTSIGTWRPFFVTLVVSSITPLKFIRVSQGLFVEKIPYLTLS